MIADCEGLRGSGQSSASRLASGQSLRKPHLERRTLKDMSRNALKNYQDEIIEHKETSTNKLHLQWASCTAALSTLGTSSTGVPANVVERPHLDVKSQGLIVRELYPRLLYTFSDVVCYITNNPR